MPAGSGATYINPGGDRSPMTEPRRGLDTEVVRDLVGLVDYQPGSIASRMLVFKHAGTITLFAFDEDTGLPEHTAPYDAIVTVLEGKARVTIRENDFTLHEGQVIIMPASVPHAVHAVTRFKMQLVMIHE